MLYLDIIYNLSLLVALSALSSFIGQRERWSATTKSVLQGIVFGGIAVIGMLYPLKLAEGVIFDGRSVVISLCGIFFGPIAAVIAAAMAIIMRVMQGGVGVLTGTLVATASALLGIGFYYKVRQRKSNVTIRHLVFLGLSVHVVMLLLMFTFPYEIALVVLKKVGLPIITVYPLATIIIGKIIHDNLERTRYTATLAASEEKYRRIAENISDVIWTTDLNLKITYISPSIERMVGESPEVYTKIVFSELFPPDALQQLLAASRAEQEQEKDPRAQKNSSRLIEVELYRADQSTIWVSMNVSILRDENGNAIGFQGVTRDINERKLAEFDLLAAKEKAVESDRLKTAFLMNMSHEIRTPMNGILGFLYLLEEPDLEEETKKEYIEIVNQSGKRLLDTINDIIEISRIESGEAEVRYEEVDIAELLQGQLVFFKPQADEKELSLEISRQVTGPSAIVQTDRHKLEGILGNLIKNAIKFTEHGGIELGYYLEGEAMRYYVKDTGRGIPEDRLEAVFERFVQADIRMNRPHEGSGLGLPIAKAYVEALSGKIWVQSEVGNGSTFNFSIPNHSSAIPLPSPITNPNRFHATN